MESTRVEAWPEPLMPSPLVPGSWRGAAQPSCSSWTYMSQQSPLSDFTKAVDLSAEFPCSILKRLPEELGLDTATPLEHIRHYDEAVTGNQSANIVARSTAIGDRSPVSPAELRQGLRDEADAILSDFRQTLSRSMALHDSAPNLSSLARDSTSVHKGWLANHTVAHPGDEPVLSTGNDTAQPVLLANASTSVAGARQGSKSHREYSLWYAAPESAAAESLRHPRRSDNSADLCIKGPQRKLNWDEETSSVGQLHHSANGADLSAPRSQYAYQRVPYYRESAGSTSKRTPLIAPKRLALVMPTAPGDVAEPLQPYSNNPVPKAGTSSASRSFGSTPLLAYPALWQQPHNQLPQLQQCEGGIMSVGLDLAALLADSTPMNLSLPYSFQSPSGSTTSFEPQYTYEEEGMSLQSAEGHHTAGCAEVDGTYGAKAAASQVHQQQQQQVLPEDLPPRYAQQTSLAPEHSLTPEWLPSLVHVVPSSAERDALPTRQPEQTPCLGGFTAAFGVSSEDAARSTKSGHSPWPPIAEEDENELSSNSREPSAELEEADINTAAALPVDYRWLSQSSEGIDDHSARSSETTSLVSYQQQHTDLSNLLDTTSSGSVAGQDPDPDEQRIIVDLVGSDLPAATVRNSDNAKRSRPASGCVRGATEEHAAVSGEVFLGEELSHGCDELNDVLEMPSAHEREELSGYEEHGVSTRLPACQAEEEEHERWIAELADGSSIGSLIARTECESESGSLITNERDSAAGSNGAVQVTRGEGEGRRSMSSVAVAIEPGVLTTQMQGEVLVGNEHMSERRFESDWRPRSSEGQSDNTRNPLQTLQLGAWRRVPLASDPGEDQGLSDDGGNDDGYACQQCSTNDEGHIGGDAHDRVQPQLAKHSFECSGYVATADDMAEESVRSQGPLDWTRPSLPRAVPSYELSWASDTDIAAELSHAWGSTTSRRESHDTDHTGTVNVDTPVATVRSLATEPQGATIASSASADAVLQLGTCDREFSVSEPRLDIRDGASPPVATTNFSPLPPSRLYTAGDAVGVALTGFIRDEPSFSFRHRRSNGTTAWRSASGGLSARRRSPRSGVGAAPAAFAVEDSEWSVTEAKAASYDPIGFHSSGSSAEVRAVDGELIGRDDATPRDHSVARSFQPWQIQENPAFEEDLSTPATSPRPGEDDPDRLHLTPSGMKSPLTAGSLLAGDNCGRVDLQLGPSEGVHMLLGLSTGEAETAWTPTAIPAAAAPGITTPTATLLLSVGRTMGDTTASCSNNSSSSDLDNEGSPCIDPPAATRSNPNDAALAAAVLHDDVNDRRDTVTVQPSFRQGSACGVGVGNGARNTRDALAAITGADDRLILELKQARDLLLQTLAYAGEAQLLNPPPPPSPAPASARAHRVWVAAATTPPRNPVALPGLTDRDAAAARTAAAAVDTPDTSRSSTSGSYGVDPLRMSTCSSGSGLGGMLGDPEVAQVAARALGLAMGRVGKMSRENQDLRWMVNELRADLEHCSGTHLELQTRNKMLQMELAKRRRDAEQKIAKHRRHIQRLEVGTHRRILELGRTNTQLSLEVQHLAWQLNNTQLAAASQVEELEGQLRRACARAGQLPKLEGELHAAQEEIENLQTIEYAAMEQLQQLQAELKAARVAMAELAAERASARAEVLRSEDDARKAAAAAEREAEHSTLVAAEIQARYEAAAAEVEVAEVELRRQLEAAVWDAQQRSNQAAEAVERAAAAEEGERVALQRLQGVEAEAQSVRAYLEEAYQALSQAQSARELAEENAAAVAELEMALATETARTFESAQCLQQAEASHRAELQCLRTELHTVQDRWQHADKVSADLQAEHVLMQARLEDLSAQLLQVHRELELLQQEREQLRSEHSRLVVQAREEGSKLAVVLQEAAVLRSSMAAAQEGELRLRAELKASEASAAHTLAAMQETHESLAADVKALQQQLAEVHDISAEAQSQLAGAEQDKSALAQQVQQLRQTLEELEAGARGQVKVVEARAVAAETALREHQIQVDVLQGNLDSLAADLVVMQDVIREREMQLEAMRAEAQATQVEHLRTLAEARSVREAMEARREAAEAACMAAEAALEVERVRVRDLNREMDVAMRKLTEAQDSVGVAEAKKQVVEMRLKEAEAKVQAAEARAQDAEAAVEVAETKTQAAVTRALEAEAKLEEMETRLQEAEVAVKAAETRVGAVEARAQEAEATVEAAEAMETQGAERRALEARVEVAEKRAQEAEAKLKEEVEAMEAAFEAMEARAQAAAEAAGERYQRLLLCSTAEVVAATPRSDVGESVLPRPPRPYACDLRLSKSAGASHRASDDGAADLRSASSPQSPNLELARQVLVASAELADLRRSQEEAEELIGELRLQLEQACDRCEQLETQLRDRDGVLEEARRQAEVAREVQLHLQLQLCEALEWQQAADHWRVAEAAARPNPWRQQQPLQQQHRLALPTNSSAVFSSMAWSPSSSLRVERCSMVMQFSPTRSLLRDSTTASVFEAGRQSPLRGTLSRRAGVRDYPESGAYSYDVVPDTAATGAFLSSVTPASLWVEPGSTIGHRHLTATPGTQDAFTEDDPIPSTCGLPYGNLAANPAAKHNGAACAPDAASISLCARGDVHGVSHHHGSTDAVLSPHAHGSMSLFHNAERPQTSYCSMECGGGGGVATGLNSPTVGGQGASSNQGAGGMQLTVQLLELRYSVQQVEQAAGELAAVMRVAPGRTPGTGAHSTNAYSTPMKAPSGGSVAGGGGGGTSRAATCSRRPPNTCLGDADGEAALQERAWLADSLVNLTARAGCIADQLNRCLDAALLARGSCSGGGGMGAEEVHQQEQLHLWRDGSAGQNLVSQLAQRVYEAELTDLRSELENERQRADRELEQQQAKHLQDYGEIAADVARYREFARQVQDVLLALQQDVHAERGRWKDQEEKARLHAESQQLLAQQLKERNLEQSSLIIRLRQQLDMATTAAMAAAAELEQERDSACDSVRNLSHETGRNHQASPVRVSRPSYGGVAPNGDDSGGFSSPSIGMTCPSVDLAGGGDGAAHSTDSCGYPCGGSTSAPADSVAVMGGESRPRHSPCGFSVRQAPPRLDARTPNSADTYTSLYRMDLLKADTHHHHHHLQQPHGRYSHLEPYEHHSHSHGTRSMTTAASPGAVGMAAAATEPDAATERDAERNGHSRSSALTPPLAVSSWALSEEELQLWAELAHLVRVEEGSEGGSQGRAASSDGGAVAAGAPLLALTAAGESGMQPTQALPSLHSARSVSDAPSVAVNVGSTHGRAQMLARTVNLVAVLSTQNRRLTRLLRGMAGRRPAVAGEGAAVAAAAASAAAAVVMGAPDGQLMMRLEALQKDNSELRVKHQNAVRTSQLAEKQISLTVKRLRQENEQLQSQVLELMAEQSQAKLAQIASASASVNVSSDHIADLDSGIVSRVQASEQSSLAHTIHPPET